MRAEVLLIRHYLDRVANELLPLCNDPNPVVRLRVAWVLAHTRDSRAFEPILALTGDPNEQVRYDATAALGILGDPRGLPELRRIWLEGNEPAEYGIAKFGPGAIEIVEEFYRSEKAVFRLGAVNIAGHWATDFGDPRSRAIIQEALNDADEQVRADAADWSERV